MAAFGNGMKRVARITRRIRSARESRAGLAVAHNWESNIRGAVIWGSPVDFNGGPHTNWKSINDRSHQWRSK